MVAVDAEQGVSPTFLTVMGIVATVMGIALIAYMIKRIPEWVDRIRAIPRPIPALFSSGPFRLPNVMWFNDLSGFGIHSLLQRAGERLRALFGPVSRRGHSVRGYAETAYGGPSMHDYRFSQASSVTLTAPYAQIASPQPAQLATHYGADPLVDRGTAASSASELQTLSLPS